MTRLAALITAALLFACLAAPQADALYLHRADAEAAATHLLPHEVQTFEAKTGDVSSCWRGSAHVFACVITLTAVPSSGGDEWTVRERVLVSLRHTGRIHVVSPFS